MRLGEVEQWKARVTDWEYRFGRYGEGFDTLADARIGLEEALGAGTGETASEATTARDGDDGDGRA